MKLLTLSLLFLVTAVRPDMYMDPRTHTCFTYPASQDIDQAKYNKYTETLYYDLLELCRTKKYTNEFMWRTACINARMTAERDDNPTARRFIADLEKLRSVHDFNEICGHDRY